MKTKVTGAKFRSALGRVGQLFRRVVWLGAVILIRSCPSAQNMAGLYKPRDMAFDRAGNLFFVVIAFRQTCRVIILFPSR